ncbi:MAG TPA: zf-HC2 domain-containing protein [Candidatus Limnocylindrales bacterium]|nr:zf-HC2 domain-containing protein [Candidatus Limnocylindrales bacterium]
MSCSSSEALFEAYLDDTLLPAQRARLLRHLNGCGRCKGVLDELRVVDALLAGPRQVELPPNFTFAAMAEVRSLPRPHVTHAPLLAYLISYLVAAWLLVGAGFLLAGSAMRAFGETALDTSAQLVHTAGAIGSAGARVAGDFGSLTAFLGAAIVLDVAVALALVVGFAVVRPRLAERLRW